MPTLADMFQRTLLLPQDTRAIDERTLFLATQPLLLPRQKAELAALATLRARGSLLAKESFWLLLDMHHVSREITMHLSETPFDDTWRKLWQDLKRLVNGESALDVELPLIPIAYKDANSQKWLGFRRHVARGWLQSVTASLDALYESDLLQLPDAANQLPDEFQMAIAAQTTETLLGNPYGIGYSLGAEGYFSVNNNLLHHIVDVLARATLESKTALDGATASGQPTGAIKTRLEHLWMMLKGLAVYVSETAYRDSLLHNIVTIDGAANQLIRALDEGYSAIVDHDDDAPDPVWNHPPMTRAARAEAMPIDALLNTLRNLFAGISTGQ